MSDATGMSSETVVLLAVLVLVVLALGIWLLLRRRGASEDIESGTSATERGSDLPSAPAEVGAASTGWAAADQPRAELAPGDDGSADATAAEVGRTSDGPTAAREPANPVDPTDSDDDSVDCDEGEPEAEGAEFAGDGLSALEDRIAADDGEVSGTAPRTPTEAFGEAEGSPPQASTEEGRRGSSLLDDPDSDSTPLFRSIREQLRASSGPTDEDLAGDEAEHAVNEVPGGDPLPAEDEVLAQPATDDEVGVRRVSELHEVVDGGFGIGSAAVIPDGAQPLGHPIKADLATNTYRDLHSPAYDQSEPDVWFLDAGFAQRAGFRRED